MENEKLPPIPTPFSQRWREFRIQVLPFVVFIATLVAIVYLWRTIVQPTGMVGFVETNQVFVASLQDGLISEIYVDRFQEVKKDQPLCTVANTDPALIEATIAAAKADLMVTVARGDVDIVRGRLNLQQLVNDLFTQKVLQAGRRAELTYAESNLVAATELRTKDIFGQLQYEAAKAKRDSLRDEIDSRDKYVTDLEQSLTKFKLTSDDPIRESVMEAVRTKQIELELSLKPTLLKAPFDGMISTVHHRAGEKVLRGSPIITISSTTTSNIIGYVRQPIQRQPKIGDFMRVTTRTTPRHWGTGQITKVGAQLEPLNPGLLSADTKRMEVGLPVVISLPKNLELFPGEFVDIAFERTNP
jgi:multidrug resistance efflux pump